MKPTAKGEKKIVLTLDSLKDVSSRTSNQQPRSRFLLLEYRCKKCGTIIQSETTLIDDDDETGSLGW